MRCIYLAAALQYASAMSCVDFVTYSLLPDGSCCFQRQIFEDLRTYTWELFNSTSVSAPRWAQAPQRKLILSADHMEGWEGLEGLGGCVALALAFVRLFESKLVVASALPLFASESLPAKQLSRATVEEGARNLRSAMKEIRASRERRDWPWRRVLRQAKRLLRVVDKTIAFPDFLDHVGWLLTHLGTKSLLLPPARQWMQHHVPVVQLTPLELHRALHSCLVALGRAQAQYFPSGGTLIGILREGELHGKQSPGRVHVLDKDLEWFVRADTPERWLELAQNISKSLISQGWFRCELIGHGANVWVGEKLLMRCVRAATEPYIAKADFHAFSVNRQSLHTGACECEHLASFTNLNLNMQGSCYCPGRPFATETVLPLRRCRVRKRIVPCPRWPAVFLAELYGNERCFRLPRAPTPPRHLPSHSRHGQRNFSGTAVRRHPARFGNSAASHFKQGQPHCCLHSLDAHSQMRSFHKLWSDMLVLCDTTEPSFKKLESDTRRQRVLETLQYLNWVTYSMIGIRR